MSDILYNELPIKDEPLATNDESIIIDSADGNKVKRIKGENLRGPRGYTGERGEPGRDGKDFKYSDFTPEQLEALRGPEGPSGSGTGDMLASVYDQNNNGKVDIAEVAESVSWENVEDKPETFTPEAHKHSISDITNLETELNKKSDVTHNHDTDYAAKSHAHTIANIENLQDTLDTKANLAGGNNFSGRQNINGRLSVGEHILVGDGINKVSDNDNASLAINYFSYKNSDNSSNTQFRDVDFFNGKYERIMKIKGSNSSVGIGTNNPEGKLDVNGLTYTKGLVIPGFNGDYWWGPRLTFTKNGADMGTSWYIGGRTNYDEGLLFEMSKDGHIFQPMSLTSKGVFSLMSETNWGRNNQLKIGSRYALSGIQHEQSGHIIQILWGDTRNNPEGSGNDGGFGLEFGSHGNPYILMSGANMNIGRTDGSINIRSPDIRFTDGSEKGISWSGNTDGARIWFYTISDGDSRLIYDTYDDHDCKHLFRIQHQDKLWIENDKITTINPILQSAAQSSAGNSLARKDYVDGSLPFKKIYDSGNVNILNSAEFYHNLNINKNDFLSGKYTFMVYGYTGDTLQTLSNIGNMQVSTVYWGNAYSNGKVAVQENILKVTGPQNIRRAIIYQNF